MSAAHGREPWGVYIHVPWCKRRCPYCAFYVEVDRDAIFGPFVDRVLAELVERRALFDGAPHTVFLGGGTPSRLPAEQLARLLGGIDRQPDAEVSAECNPEDCDEAWLEQAVSAGINRVSLGVQTFQAHHARLLNRACSVPTARETVRRVARADLRSWSIDLIFALPGQSMADLDADLDAIVDSGAPHVALYGLTVEPGTPFERAQDRGQLVIPDPDAWRRQYDHIVERLTAAGLERYEVSNFAAPGHRCRHNELYWTDRPYLGLGPSAHSYLPDGSRTHNVRDVAAYVRTVDATAEHEHPTGRDAAIDLLVSALRGRDGVTLDRVAARSGHTLDNAAVERLVAKGLLRSDGSRIALTGEGFPVADAIVAHLVDTLVPIAGL